MTKFQGFIAALIFSAALLPAHAADPAAEMTPPPVAVSTASFIPAAALSPGRYGVAVTPDFNSSMAKRLKTAVDQMPGVRDVSTIIDRSVIMFTVEEGTTQVRMNDLQKVVAKTYATASITTPVLEGTMTPRPGL